MDYGEITQGIATNGQKQPVMDYEEITQVIATKEEKRDDSTCKDLSRSFPSNPGDRDEGATYAEERDEAPSNVGLEGAKSYKPNAYTKNIMTASGNISCIDTGKNMGKRDNISTVEKSIVINRVFQESASEQEKQLIMLRNVKVCDGIKLLVQNRKKGISYETPDKPSGYETDLGDISSIKESPKFKSDTTEYTGEEGLGKHRESKCSNGARRIRDHDNMIQQQKHGGRRGKEIHIEDKEVKGISKIEIKQECQAVGNGSIGKDSSFVIADGSRHGQQNGCKLINYANHTAHSLPPILTEVDTPKVGESNIDTTKRHLVQDEASESNTNGRLPVARILQEEGQGVDLTERKNGVEANNINSSASPALDKLRYRLNKLKSSTKTLSEDAVATVSFGDGIACHSDSLGPVKNTAEGKVDGLLHKIEKHDGDDTMTTTARERRKQKFNKLKSKINALKNMVSTNDTEDNRRNDPQDKINDSIKQEQHDCLITPFHLQSIVIPGNYKNRSGDFDLGNTTETIYTKADGDLEVFAKKIARIQNIMNESGLSKPQNEINHINTSFESQVHFSSSNAKNETEITTIDILDTTKSIDYKRDNNISTTNREKNDLCDQKHLITKAETAYQVGKDIQCESESTTVSNTQDFLWENKKLKKQLKEMEQISSLNAKRAADAIAKRDETKKIASFFRSKSLAQSKIQKEMEILFKSVQSRSLTVTKKLSSTKEKLKHAKNEVITIKKFCETEGLSIEEMMMCFQQFEFALLGEKEKLATIDRERNCALEELTKQKCFTARIQKQHAEVLEFKKEEMLQFALSIERTKKLPVQKSHVPYIKSVFVFSSSSGSDESDEEDHMDKYAMRYDENYLDHLHRPMKQKDGTNKHLELPIDKNSIRGEVKKHQAHTPSCRKNKDLGKVGNTSLIDRDCLVEAGTSNSKVQQDSHTSTSISANALKGTDRFFHTNEGGIDKVNSSWESHSTKITSNRSRKSQSRTSDQSRHWKIMSRSWDCPSNEGSTKSKLISWKNPLNEGLAQPTDKTSYNAIGRNESIFLQGETYQKIETESIKVKMCGTRKSMDTRAFTSCNNSIPGVEGIELVMSYDSYL